MSRDRGKPSAEHAQRAEALIARLKAARGSGWAPRARRILETCKVPGGAPTFHCGLSALIKLDAEETK